MTTLCHMVVRPFGVSKVQIFEGLFPNQHEAEILKRKLDRQDRPRGIPTGPAELFVVRDDIGLSALTGWAVRS